VFLRQDTGANLDFHANVGGWEFLLDSAIQVGAITTFSCPAVASRALF
jgi:hypothetical protein